ncbi:MAG: hypothetical protein DRJ33_05170 [Candidatus Methanomethylicota archaeon]|uniref:Pyruvate/ketoisovalerate oxidoreductase catalytic domain-containing protein n=1 Tax=Thermoproteota archaeon TaxID=2056631 RepID=A0A497EXN0_9CREN|nr:MAG: hypothetical protein DRJ33_05170 [Candidatus Verstraetearchaeota archaeon]
MGKVWGIEAVVRGVTQTAVGAAMVDIIGFAAIKDGKAAISYERYDDAPDRVFLGMKSFAIVGESWEDLEAYVMMYEPPYINVSVVLEPSLVKGIQSWAYIGQEPIHGKLVPNGIILVDYDGPIENLAKIIPPANKPYKLAVVNASGIDKLVTAPLAGALAKVAPEIASKEALLNMIKERYKAVAEEKAKSFEKGYEAVKVMEVKPSV